MRYFRVLPAVALVAVVAGCATGPADAAPDEPPFTARSVLPDGESWHDPTG